MKSRASELSLGLTALCIVVCLLLSVCAWAQPSEHAGKTHDALTACLAGMAPGTWKDAAKCVDTAPTLLSVAYESVKNPPAPLTYNARIAREIHAVQGPAGMTQAWSGAAFDTRDRWLVIGNSGGHGAYSGNEVYAFDLATLKWRRLNDPSDPSKVRCMDLTYPDGHPIPVHTYGSVNYDPTTNSYFQVGIGPVGTYIGLCRNINVTGDIKVGSREITNVSPSTTGIQVTDNLRCTTCKTANFGTYVQVTAVGATTITMASAATGHADERHQTFNDGWRGGVAAYIYAFNLSTRTWSRRLDFTTSQMVRCLNNDTLTGVDPTTDKVYITNPSGYCASSVWDLRSNAFTPISNGGHQRDYHMAGGAVRPGVQMVEMGYAGLNVLDFARGMSTPTATGDLACQNYAGPNRQGAAGIVWDSAIKKYVAFVPARSTVCTLDPKTWKWTAFAMRGDTPAPEDGNGNGIYGRFVYDAIDDCLIEVSCASCHVFIGKMP